METTEYRIKDICQIIDGDRGKNYPTDSDFLENDYCLFLNASNVTKYGWNFSDVHFISKEKDGILHNGKVQLNDIIMTTRGTVGNFTLFDSNVPYEHLRINSGMVIIRPIDSINRKFLYFLFKSDYIQSLIKLYCSGSAQPQLPIKDFRKIKLNIPPLPTQQKIAGILSKYDEAIENNNKRIKFLEQMAQNLYKEWFVRFRFPGWQNAEFENGIPKGWKVEKLEDFANIYSGGDKPQIFSEKKTEEYSVPIYSNGIENDGLYGYTNVATIKEECITISARGTVGFVCLREEPFLPIVRLLSIVPKNCNYLSKYLFYYFQMNSVESNGTSQQQITIPMIARKKVLMPSVCLIQDFENKISSLFLQKKILTQKKQNISRQRDLLLPRLMSGKLQIK